MKTKALVDKLAYILPKLEVEAVVDAVVVTLAEVKAETLGDSDRVKR